MSAHLKNGEFYARDGKVFRAPIETKTETGQSINVGFPVCTVSEYVSAENVAECLNASRHYDALVNALRYTLCELTACANQLASRGMSIPEGSSVWQAQAAARAVLATIKVSS